MSRNPFADWTESSVQAHNDKVAKTRVNAFTRNADRTAQQVENLQAKADLTENPTTDEEDLNKTEKRFLSVLRSRGLPWIGIQCVTLKLGHDLRYTPDFTTLDHDGRMTHWDTKGGFVRDDAVVKIKAAARHFRMFRFIIAQWKDGQWDEKLIKP